VLLTTPGRPNEQDLCEEAVHGIGVPPEVPALSFDARLGYVQSLNALLHIQFAAEIVGSREPVAENVPPCSKVLVLSQTVNGGFGAAVVGRAEADS
jgi:hypothetical protein